MLGNRRLSGVSVGGLDTRNGLPFAFWSLLIAILLTLYVASVLELATEPFLSRLQTWQLAYLVDTIDHLPVVPHRPSSLIFACF